jgi:hypothetical protein
MRLLRLSACLLLGPLVVGCGDQGTEVTGPIDPPVFASSEGSVFVPIAEDAVFCFDGEWSPPFGDEDPSTWPSGWGNVAILFPEDGESPPRDMLRLKNNPSQFHLHYGLSGPIVLGYENARYEGFGHSRFTLFFNERRGGVRAEVSIVGKVQDGDGAWYHLNCKDINEDMANEQYAVTMMNLNPM